MPPSRRSRGCSFPGTCHSAACRERASRCENDRTMEQDKRENEMKARLSIVALLLIAMTLPAAALEKASLRLNWLIYGFHSPFYLGVVKGYYQAEGIDLEIGEGKGSASAVQVVGAKGDTFGLSDGASIINGISKGAPIRAVMGIMNTTPFAIIV